MDKKTQKKLAERLQIKPYNLSRYLTGRSRPRLEEAERLAMLAPETNVWMWMKKRTKELRKALEIEE